MDLVGKIMAWESGELSGNETIKFFGELVASGKAWSLQGMYGRFAMNLIESGYLSRSGEVLKEVEEWL